MDKIQDAIAKARAARGTPEAGAMAQPEVQVRPQPEPIAPRPVDAAAGAPVVAKTTMTQPATASVVAAWETVPLYTPSPARLRRNRIMTLEGGRHATDFDVLRTRVLQQAKAHGWRRIAVTSPGPGCGKSTLVLNLAFSLARQRDQRTLVAEMDMRRPSLAKTLGLKERLNLSDTLKGDSPFESNALRLDSNLMVSTNSGPVPRAAELLQSPDTAAVLNDITARYDPTIVLFDMPPLLAGDDTMAFLSQVDCVILLAAAEQSTIKQIDACEQDIASQTSVMGVVLNKCRYMDRDNSYAYYE
jgi:Mrp family chromosome partitioning ATPase